MRRSKWRSRRFARSRAVLALDGDGRRPGRPRSRNGAAKADGGSLTVWLSGHVCGCDAGSYVPQVARRDQGALREGSTPARTVKFVLTPINNAQFTAQIAAAFASKKVPDAMLVYSGGYTTPYMLSSLQKLNDQVTPDAGFYGTQTAWDLSCLNLDCKGGKGDIYASRTISAPTGSSTTRRCSRRRGSRTAEDVQGAARRLQDFKAKGILPLAYGDRDGYSTDNWVTHDYASYMAKGDIALVNDRQDEVRRSQAREAARGSSSQFKKQGCVNPDASTHENNDANTYFTSGKAAMVQMFPFVIKDFEKALGKNLGLARLPQSGPNPGRTAVELVPQLGDPEERGQQGRRVGVHQDGGRQKGGADLATKVGALPTNKAAAASSRIRCRSSS